MSTTRKTTRVRNVKPLVITPMIGSLLRLPHEVMVGRMLESLQAHGFQVTMTELRVFLFPGPDGLRPAELSRRCDMTRQAMNYVLASLERQDLIERRDGADVATRVVHLTARGWRLIEQIRECVATVEGEWAALLGKERFEELRQTLHELSKQLGKVN
ncbi:MULTISPECIES: MarR family winged helix-turn-helix transcriptional regulator [unclassified Variovorax]|uniref:MarR family winged helix-turn-helix transcriptional regulator n=1 Tax=unclassified Variovorax TaxID=663243 RepID=UPI001BD44FEB|nr:MULTISPECIES: MarR family transcriptional regulator [unclassified Variovorax]